MTVRLEFSKYCDLHFVRYCQIERLYIPGSATPMHQAGSSLAVAGQRGSLLAGQRPGPRSRPAQSCLMYRPRKGVCKRFPGLMSLLRIRFRACHDVQFSSVTMFWGRWLQPYIPVLSGFNTISFSWKCFAKILKKKKKMRKSDAFQGV